MKDVIKYIKDTEVALKWANDNDINLDRSYLMETLQKLKKVIKNTSDEKEQHLGYIELLKEDVALCTNAVVNLKFGQELQTDSKDEVKKSIRRFKKDTGRKYKMYEVVLREVEQYAR